MSATEMEMTDLFGYGADADASSGRFRPLAERVRPESADELFGQAHLVGPDGPVRRYLAQGRIPSMIFWGPPGSGKTTLAEVCARSLNYRFEQLSATEAGVRDVRRVLETAVKTRRIENRQTLLFIDEIHRFNKAQQDTLLHAIEQGLIVLIGATTENPSFEVNRALLSRMQVYILKPLGDDDVRRVLDRAIRSDAALSGTEIDPQALEFLLHYAGGDARKALNALEVAVSLLPQSGGQRPMLDRKLFEQALQHRAAEYDKGGEAHYDVVSAFIKSMRGSDPDAALVWLARMLAGGEDPKFIARRMLIFASEDIGNADPYAVTLAMTVFNAVEVIGMPEARINLAQGVTYLAACPKSNASYVAFNEASAAVREAGTLEVPLHLRNAPTSFMKGIGYGAGYQYPHSYPGHFVDASYFPEQFSPKAFYRPGTEGRERFLKERLESLRADRYQN